MAVDADIYLLPRDELERRRLDLQHTVITRFFDGCLPRSLSLGSHDRILEIGSGTGVWSIDLASQVPNTVSFETTDISSVNFPKLPNDKVPSNITFSTHGVLNLPEEWTGRFDVVLQRLILSGITREEWVPALRELHRVMKPGAHIVLVEIDPESWTELQIKERSQQICPAEVELTKIWGHMVHAKNMLWHLTPVLPIFLKEAGFEVLEVEEKIFSTEGGITTLEPENDGKEGSSLADDALCCMVRLYQSFRASALETGLIDEARYDQLLEDMTVEWKNVQKTEAGRGFPWIRICAQKPVQAN